MLGEFRCSGRYGVTEFFSERAITFHITAGVERSHLPMLSLPTLLFISQILKTGSDLVK